MFPLDDTIAAIATAPGAPAARAILRISGRDAIDCLSRCFMPSAGCSGLPSASPRAVPGMLSSGLAQPCDAYIWPSRRSYTREPVAELHLFGSPPLAEAALRTVCAHGARLAQPGEFTLRAFLAGRLDLIQAEAVLGVIDAHDRRALDVALEQLAGGLSGPLSRLRGDLLDLLADLEAGLDFVEEHIEFVNTNQIVDRLTAARAELYAIVDSLSARGLPGEAPRVALVGWPNTGKSSLFNALAGRERSLVSDEVGTTRDYLQAKVDFGGIVCTLIDTAGFEAGEETQTIKATAERLSQSQRRHADLRLLCIDATRPINDWERERLESRDNTLVVLTKCDRPKAVSLDRSAIETSAVRGQGLGVLASEIAARLSAHPAGHAVASTVSRCRASAARVIERLASAQRVAEERGGEELVAADLRLALDELGKITGAVYTEDVLDRIFSRFCIGK